MMAVAPTITAGSDGNPRAMKPPSVQLAHTSRP